MDLKATVARYRKTAHGLADWLEKNIPRPSPSSPSQPLIGGSYEPTKDSSDSTRRSNALHVSPPFFNEASILRLVSAVLGEISDD